MRRRGAVGCAGVLAMAIGMAGCGQAPVLLFTGDGTSRNDVAAVEAILRGNRLEYSTAGSWRLNRMGEKEIGGYRLLIVPGGNFIEIGKGLSSGTTARIRGAVRGWLNYLGICAGGFFAGDSGFNGLNLSSGARFGFYAAEERGIRKAAVAITGAGGVALEQYWEDGPQFTGWGAVAARYPDGTPAVVEGTFGSGWVVLSGVHPEAPEAWRRGMAFSTPVEADRDYAGLLVRAALGRIALAK